MAGQKKQKKVPPKPQGQIKKQQRDARILAALKEQRAKRREANKAKRAQILKKAQQYNDEHNKRVLQQVNARRLAKNQGQIYVPAAPKVAIVMRIRGVMSLNPKVVRIMRLLRLRQLHNAAFVRINKASLNLLRRVEPYITYGYPSRETIKRLVYKRGFGKVNGQRIPLTNNSVISQTLGKHGIECTEDLINEIYTCGPHFKQANNFLWPFKLRAPRGGWNKKRHPFQRGGDWGNRQEFINNVVKNAL